MLGWGAPLLRSLSLMELDQGGVERVYGNNREGGGELVPASVAY